MRCAIVALLTICVSTQVKSETSDLYGYIANLKGDGYLEQAQPDRPRVYVRISDILLTKAFYIVTKRLTTGGVCGKTVIETYDYSDDFIDSQLLEELCDTEDLNAPYSSTVYNRYTDYHYQVKETTSYTSDDEEEVLTEYRTFEYKINSFSGHIDTLDPFSKCSGIKHPELSQTKLSDTSLTGASPESLQLMRNELFARYGHTFQSAKLSSYFESCNWYTPLNINLEESMTALEKENIQTILLQEEKLH